MISSIKTVGMTFVLLVACVADQAMAGYIAPVSATGTGSYSGNASVIIDGTLPPRGTPYNSPTSTVSWVGTSTYFTIDFGAIYSVANLIVAVDNNDDYVIQYSTNGTTFSNLFTFLASDGPVTPGQGGLDLLTTDPSYPSSVSYPPDTTTPEYVGRGFAPVDARYLRVSAANGDSLYAVGQIDAFTSAVPEPSSLMLTGMASLAGLGYWTRKRRKSMTA